MVPGSQRQNTGRAAGLFGVFEAAGNRGFRRPDRPKRQPGNREAPTAGQTEATTGKRGVPAAGHGNWHIPIPAAGHITPKRGTVRQSASRREQRSHTIPEKLRTRHSQTLVPRPKAAPSRGSTYGTAARTGWHKRHRPFPIRAFGSGCPEYIGQTRTLRTQTGGSPIPDGLRTRHVPCPGVRDSRRLPHMWRPFFSYFPAGIRSRAVLAGSAGLPGLPEGRRAREVVRKTAYGL